MAADFERIGDGDDSLSGFQACDDECVAIQYGCGHVTVVRCHGEWGASSQDEGRVAAADGEFHLRRAYQQTERGVAVVVVAA